MEVKIGVQRSPRELVLESVQSPDEVQNQVTEALRDPDGTLVLIDEKGRRVLIPAKAVAYVEIAESDHRPVGFTVPD